MRSIFVFFGIFSFSTLLYSKPSSLWGFDKKDGISNPESVYFDEESKSFFVSNISGEGTAKDKLGWISKISQNGKNFQSQWISGLNAPKGMRVFKGKLWVTDIDELVEIDINASKIINRYPVSGAQFLNDLAISSDGTVYVSDTQGNKIYQLKGYKIEVFLDGSQLEAANGLLIDGTTLYVATWGKGIKADWTVLTPGSLHKVNLITKNISLMTQNPLGNLDGIEKHPDGGFIISDWVSGKVFHVQTNGKSKEIFVGVKGTADIGLDFTQRLLLIPSMQEDRVNAYQL